MISIVTVVPDKMMPQFILVFFPVQLNIGTAFFFFSLNVTNRVLSYFLFYFYFITCVLKHISGNLVNTCIISRYVILYILLTLEILKTYNAMLFLLIGVKSVSHIVFTFGVHTQKTQQSFISFILYWIFSNCQKLLIIIHLSLIKCSLI